MVDVKYSFTGGVRLEYTIQKLGLLAGVSTRTLRYYDEIGLLNPARINSSKYRIYGQQEVDRLQQILFYRELGVGLEDIKKILLVPDFDGASALRDHHEKLVEKRSQIEKLITNVEKSIEHIEGKMTMSDKEKFEGFKKKLVDGNEKKYGKEVREKYGNDVINRSNQKVLNMTEDENEAITKLADEIKITLAAAFQTGDPAGELAQKAVDMHRQWLCFYWDGYSKEAHAGLGQMYVDDERFRAYYDKETAGTAEFLRDAILVYVGE